MLLRALGLFLLAGALAGAPTTKAIAQTPTAATAAEEPRDPPPPLPPETLKDATIIAKGEKLWQDQCTHCHGAKAYPGKAPKLQPRTYKPEFVWDRVHNGFRGMPPWKSVYQARRGRRACRLRLERRLLPVAKKPARALQWLTVTDNA